MQGRIFSKLCDKKTKNVRIKRIFLKGSQFLIYCCWLWPRGS